jgi:serine/threonine-protein kinase
VVLARRETGRLEPVLLDFGISRLEAGSPEQPELTRSEALLGTVHYLSPEQLRCAKLAGPRSDQYALGVMLYECATGRRPFFGDSQYELMNAIVHAPVVAPSRYAGHLPPGFDELVLRAMSRNPADRFRSVGALASALLSFADKPSWGRWAREVAGIDTPPDGEAGPTAHDERGVAQSLARAALGAQARPPGPGRRGITTPAFCGGVAVGLALGLAVALGIALAPEARLRPLAEDSPPIVASQPVSLNCGPSPLVLAISQKSDLKKGGPGGN